MSFKKILAAGLLSCYFNYSAAQILLNGTVKNESGFPVAGAIISFENSMQSTHSGADGQFVIEKQKSGDVTLHVNLLGYYEYKQKLSLQTNQKIEVVLFKNPIVSDEIIITATRIAPNAGMPVNQITKKEIEENNSGKDVPMLLDQLPGVVSTSDAGAGIGYTGLRLRGSDATRINVTINGIPINDAESQGMYWVDLPDILSSVEDIQVQRGVGTSTNGAGAFGGSINILTDRLHEKPFTESSISFGAFNTKKANIKAGTGLLNNKFAFETRLSKIESAGYIDRASSDLRSIFISGGYYGAKTLLKFVVFSGKEITYQSWNGTPESRIKNDVEGMQNYIDRNGLDAEEAANLLNSGRTYNFYTYANQVDNYQQDNYQLHFSHQFNTDFVMNAALHLTQGKGYYEEYKKSEKLSSYSISNVIIGDTLIKRSDLIRRKWLANDFYGGTYSVQYQKSIFQTILGGGINQYNGDHYGEVIWARYASGSEINQRYYADNGLKNDVNTFLKTTLKVNPKFTAWIDLQMRFVSYRFLGFDDAFANATQKVFYTFFNPKIGLSYKTSANSLTYVSASTGSKEPSRDDFKDSSPQSRPSAEKLVDVEIGYKYANEKLSVAANLYFMSYQNQLVLTGKVNDVGNYTRENVKTSFRNGMEVEANYKLLNNMMVNAAIAFSENKISNYTYYLDEYDAEFNYIGQTKQAFKTTSIAFSPPIILSGGLSYKIMNSIKISATEKFVDKQFLDNTSSADKAIASFAYTNLSLAYAFKIKNLITIEAGFSLYNVFNSKYESNGYTYGYRYDNETINENFYYPQAGLHYLGQVILKF